MATFGRPVSISPRAGKAFSPASAEGKATPGKSRVCPHCKSTILDSASVCPACQHHLKFDRTAEAQRKAAATLTPLKVEGCIKHPAGAEPWEYSVVLAIRNDRGEEVTRQVVGVGALQNQDERSFTLSVEVTVPPGKDGAK
jgi:hypothetical protein